MACVSTKWLVVKDGWNLSEENARKSKRLLVCRKMYLAEFYFIARYLYLISTSSKGIIFIQVVADVALTFSGKSTLPPIPSVRSIYQPTLWQTIAQRRSYSPRTAKTVWNKQERNLPNGWGVDKLPSKIKSPLNKSDLNIPRRILILTINFLWLKPLAFFMVLFLRRW